MAIDLPVLAIIIVLVPMFYLLLASPAFLLVRLDIPQVAYVLRSVFFGYFVVLVAVGLVATALFALDGRVVPALFLGVLTLLDLIWRRWVMRRVDVLLVETEAGITGTGPRLRRLHWAGMGANALQLAATLAVLPAFVAQA